MVEQSENISQWSEKSGIIYGLVINKEQDQVGVYNYKKQQSEKSDEDNSNIKNGTFNGLEENREKFLNLKEQDN